MLRTMIQRQGVMRPRFSRTMAVPAPKTEAAPASMNLKGASVFQSPARYVQLPGLVHEVANVVKAAFPESKRAGIIISKRSVPTAAGQALINSAANPVVYEYEGECTKAGVQAVKERFEKEGVDHVVGFGGGKLIDVGKLVADQLKARSIVVPSIASTDAPCTALSVLYHDDGTFDEYVFFSKSPDMVLVDSEVILGSPLRFLVAGMGDALSTYYEARACHRNPQGVSLVTPFIYRPPLLAEAIGRKCRDILFAFGPAALLAVKEQKLSPAFESVVEANILMSGLGAESGGLAGAHAMHNALNELPEAHGSLHGEKVAFGTICQLFMEGDVEEATRVATLCKMVGLPTQFKEMGITMDDQKFKIVLEHCLGEKSSCWNVSPDLTPQLVIDSMIAADRLGASITQALNDAAEQAAEKQLELQAA